MRNIVQEQLDRSFSKQYYPLHNLCREGFYLQLPYRSSWSHITPAYVERLLSLYPKPFTPRWLTLCFVYSYQPWIGVKEIRVGLMGDDPMPPFMQGMRVLWNPDTRRYDIISTQRHITLA